MKIPDSMYFLIGLDTKERLAKQRQQVNAQLGLDTMAALGVDTSDIVSEEDIACGSANPIKIENKVIFPSIYFQTFLCFNHRYKYLDLLFSEKFN